MTLLLDFACIILFISLRKRKNRLSISLILDFSKFFKLIHIHFGSQPKIRTTSINCLKSSLKIISNGHAISLVMFCSSGRWDDGTTWFSCLYFIQGFDRSRRMEYKSITIQTYLKFLEPKPFILSLPSINPSTSSQSKYTI